MAINVFGSTTGKTENKIDTSLFVQKPYLTNSIQTNIEDDIYLKNQFRIEKIPDPISIREAASKSNVDKKFNNPSIIKNTAHVDFNYKNVDTVRFVKVNSKPAVGGHLTAKYYVDQAISNSVEEPTLGTINQDIKFSDFSLFNKKNFFK